MTHFVVSYIRSTIATPLWFNEQIIFGHNEHPIKALIVLGCTIRRGFNKKQTVLHRYFLFLQYFYLNMPLLLSQITSTEHTLAKSLQLNDGLQLSRPDLVYRVAYCTGAIIIPAAGMDLFSKFCFCPLADCANSQSTYSTYCYWYENSRRRSWGMPACCYVWYSVTEGVRHAWNHTRYSTVFSTCCEIAETTFSFVLIRSFKLMSSLFLCPVVHPAELFRV